MKRNVSLLVILIAVCSGILSLSFMNTALMDELPLNSAIPLADYKMKDITGNTLSLGGVKTDKGLLVIFSCNTCPYVRLSESRIKEYTDFCLSNGIGCALINSNEAQRNEDDSFDEMVKYHAAKKLKCVYALDENSQLANAFGASRTPQCFLFNNKGLVYKGAIDDNVKDPLAVKSPYLKDALGALLKNEAPKTQETKSIGCTIKRVE